MTRHDEIVTIGKASLDQVLAERDQAVARMQSTETAMRTMADEQAALRKDAVHQLNALVDKLRKDAVHQLNALVDKLRKDNAVLKSDNEALVAMVAQWSGVDNPSAKYTLVEQARLERLEDIEAFARRMARLLDDGRDDEEDHFD